MSFLNASTNTMINPPKAAAHRACNATTTKQEESFRNLLVASGAVSTEHTMFDKMMRSLGRPEARGMRADWHRRMYALPDGSGIVGIPEGYPEWVLPTIAKGALYTHSGVVLRPSAVR